ncbi:N-acetylmannosamine-6-phosphate 2-epimerase [Paenibacillus senegalensis]|uniref:N-acetylmannosamine-6-phosphate 2-epimerase n=1 Tax=Paenibacillus senegalensis TaxID=1465766 RepID=UPI000289B21E|nr:N-acetylmannosamine-6-phosphate 2-epimerase [Paenibacillus senegalensis]
MTHSIIASFQNGCIVSCQALEDEPLYGSDIMAAMAKAAEQGGAVGIRANTPADIRAIKQVTKLPVIGLYKKNYPGSDVYITPTMNEIREVIAAGADIVALDATKQARPGGVTLKQLFQQIREEYPHILILADVSVYEEGVYAMDLGADLVSTTLSGYTPYSPQQKDPDIDLVARLAALNRTPILAEGRIWTVEQCQESLQQGAYAVIIGSAITRPQEITKRFVSCIQELKPLPKG